MDGISDTNIKGNPLMIQPNRLKLAGKSQKQIIDGLTARNLEMHIDNCEMAKLLAAKEASIEYLVKRTTLLEELLLQNTITIPALLGGK